MGIGQGGVVLLEAAPGGGVRFRRDLQAVQITLYRLALAIGPAGGVGFPARGKSGPAAAVVSQQGVVPRKDKAGGAELPLPAAAAFELPGNAGGGAEGGAKHIEAQAKLQGFRGKGRGRRREIGPADNQFGKCGPAAIPPGAGQSAIGCEGGGKQGGFGGGGALDGYGAVFGVQALAEPGQGVGDNLLVQGGVKEDVNAAPSHIGGYGNRARRAGLPDDFGFGGAGNGIEQAVVKALLH